MSNNTKRRDTRGRVLNNGETQLSSGEYTYQCVVNGKRVKKHSWRLTEADPVPKGKRFCKALRTLENDLAKDIEAGLYASTDTLNEIFDVSIDSKYGRASEDTKADYKYRYNSYVRDHKLGGMPIKAIQQDDIQSFDDGLLDQGTGSSVVDRLNRILSRTMSYAIRKGLRNDNPVQGVIVDYVPKDVQALDEEQSESLLEFVRNSKTFSFWHDHIRTLLNTGMRIGEFAGFVWDEYDESMDTIHVRQAVNLHMTPDKSKIVELDTPKSQSGIRDIPANTVVKEILSSRKQKQLEKGSLYSYKALGTSGFVFLNQAGTFINRDNFRTVMKRIQDAYNAEEKARAEKEHRIPRLMPAINPHVLRHTFCTRLCEVETNVPRIKEIMGHSDISVTLNIYNTVTLKAKKETMSKLVI